MQRPRLGTSWQYWEQLRQTRFTRSKIWQLRAQQSPLLRQQPCTQLRQESRLNWAHCPGWQKPVGDRKYPLRQVVQVVPLLLKAEQKAGRQRLFQGLYHCLQVRQTRFTQSTVRQLLISRRLQVPFWRVKSGRQARHCPVGEQEEQLAARQVPGYWAVFQQYWRQSPEQLVRQQFWQLWGQQRLKRTEGLGKRQSRQARHLGPLQARQYEMLRLPFWSFWKPSGASSLKQQSQLAQVQTMQQRWVLSRSQQYTQVWQSRLAKNTAHLRAQHSPSVLSTYPGRQLGQGNCREAQPLQSWSDDAHSPWALSSQPARHWRQTPELLMFWQLGSVMSTQSPPLRQQRGLHSRQSSWRGRRQLGSWQKPATRLKGPRQAVQVFWTGLNCWQRRDLQRLNCSTQLVLQMRQLARASYQEQLAIWRTQMKLLFWLCFTNPDLHCPQLAASVSARQLVPMKAHTEAWLIGWQSCWHCAHVASSGVLYTEQYWISGMQRSLQRVKPDMQLVHRPVRGLAARQFWIILPQSPDEVRQQPFRQKAQPTEEQTWQNYSGCGRQTPSLSENRAEQTPQREVEDEREAQLASRHSPVQRRYPGEQAQTSPRVEQATPLALSTTQRPFQRKKPVAQVTQVPGRYWRRQLASRGQATLFWLHTKYPLLARITSPCTLLWAAFRPEATAAPLTREQPLPATRQMPPAWEVQVEAERRMQEPSRRMSKPGLHSRHLPNWSQPKQLGSRITHCPLTRLQLSLQARMLPLGEYRSIEAEESPAQDSQQITPLREWLPCLDPPMQSLAMAEALAAWACWTKLRQASCCCSENPPARLKPQKARVQTSEEASYWRQQGSKQRQRPRQGRQPCLQPRQLPLTSWARQLGSRQKQLPLISWYWLSQTRQALFWAQYWQPSRSWKQRVPTTRYPWLQAAHFDLSVPQVRQLAASSRQARRTQTQPCWHAEQRPQKLQLLQFEVGKTQPAGVSEVTVEQRRQTPEIAFICRQLGGRATQAKVRGSSWQRVKQAWQTPCWLAVRQVTFLTQLRVRASIWKSSLQKTQVWRVKLYTRQWGSWGRQPPSQRLKRTGQMVHYLLMQSPKSRTQMKLESRTQLRLQPAQRLRSVVSKLQLTSSSLVKLQQKPLAAQQPSLQRSQQIPSADRRQLEICSRQQVPLKKQPWQLQLLPGHASDDDGVGQHTPFRAEYLELQLRHDALSIDEALQCRIASCSQYDTPPTFRGRDPAEQLPMLLLQQWMKRTRTYPAAHCSQVATVRVEETQLGSMVRQTPEVSRNVELHSAQPAEDELDLQTVHPSMGVYNLQLPWSSSITPESQSWHCCDPGSVAKQFCDCPAAGHQTRQKRKTAKATFSVIQIIQNTTAAAVKIVGCPAPPPPLCHASPPEGNRDGRGSWPLLSLRAIFEGYIQLGPAKLC